MRLSMEKKFGEMLVKMADSQQHRLLDAAHIIIEITRFLHAHKPVKKGAEDTFIHYSLAPFINNIFHGDHIDSYRANSSLASNSKIRPDFTLHATLLGHRYDMFMVEVKPLQSPLTESDFINLAKDLMCMLNKLVGLQVPGPAVHGMWVDGMQVQTFKMDLVANGMYRLVEMDSFELVRSFDDLSRMRAILQKLGNH
ncbi:hypothetical protein O0I10_012549 [Lichtheimia ornata]|uniref:Uncharacterized protein n=1 Tax=Lichtheimia ornata TaxID=688661 RepID=A0AAD7URI5_9FUNG|nr:uncharacterized protein O0I10_012549 [Lichtheimia ornata]KAJ8651880.1 hypothetical protein O0I10_012549 [Lichtheimia ornata]